MPCSITISSVSGTTTGGTLTSIQVSGTATGCASGQVDVFINCGSPKVIKGTANINNLGDWTVSFTAAQFQSVLCACDKNITVNAQCVGNTSCAAAPLTVQLHCAACCDVKVFPTVDTNCDNGKRFVTFQIVNNCASIVNASLDFKDGTLPLSLSLTPGPNNPPGHMVLPGTYPAVLQIPGCPVIAVPFTVDPCLCCDVQVSTPTVSANCNNGKRTVTFQILNKCPAPINAQFDFNDGLSIPVSLAPGITKTLTHVYGPGTYTAVLQLSAIPGCADVSTTFTVPPCCCPQITTSVEVGQCDDFGNTKVCLTGIVDVPTGCKVTVQWDFGDGQKGGNHSFSAGSNTFTECHDYAPGSYQAQLNVGSPSGCKPSSIKVNVPPCDCCPSISVDPCIEDCDKHGNRLVTFVVHVTAKPAPCPTVQVQMDFGDGTSGGLHTYPVSGSGSYTETHIYSGSGAQQDNTASLNVLAPQGCPGWSDIIRKCCKPKRIKTCKLLLLTASVLLALSLYFLATSFCYPLCTSLTGWCFALSPTLLQQISLGLAVLGLIPLIIFLLLCRKCICGWILLLLWRILFFVGALYATFAKCCWGFWSLVIGIALMSIALAILLKWKRDCCVKCCIFLGEILLWVGAVVLVAIAYFNSSLVWSQCVYVLFTFTLWNFTITITFWQVLLFVWGLFGVYYWLTCPCSEKDCKDC